MIELEPMQVISGELSSSVEKDTVNGTMTNMGLVVPMKFSA